MEERLQKLIATAGIASRRAAEELIAAGEVTVNGQTVTEPGTKADPARDHIKVRGRLINPLLAEREKTYVLLNKPRGYLASLADPEGRPLVSELVPASLGRLHPVGRLDFNTEGLLILTNDGELTNFITAARNKVEKVYEVKVKGVPPEAAVERLRRGIVLEDGTRAAPAVVERTDETKTNSWFEVILHEGRNQQIRRMFDAIGHSVTKLRRVRIGSLRDDRLPTGAWRHLMPGEVASLKRGDTRGGRGGGAKSAKGGAGRGERSAGGARREPSREPRKKPARGASKARGAGHARG
ncbi:MAG: rRNA pseudouridine synthase [Acidobacteria bacterium]|nr:rRNA pseudouridine synthase [Acidobacteriota bacterium]MCA1643408.1 rRNA pseudouridine synthase [Acidobacteriota bacterium]